MALLLNILYKKTKMNDLLNKNFDFYTLKFVYFKFFFININFIQFKFDLGLLDIN